MATKVYFVRHAEPDFSIKDDMIRPLTDKGMEDSKKVTKALINKDINSIFSSPYKRAYDTIKDLAIAIDMEIQVHNDFRERNVGTWVEDFKAFSLNQWSDFDFKMLEGDSLREVQERNIAALLQLLDNNSNKNVVIGTHGTALSAIINYFNPNFGYDDFWNMIDKMPYILCFSFHGRELKNIEEIEIW